MGSCVRLLQSVVLTLVLFQPVAPFEAACRGSRPGDCDPNACGGQCEARYARFYDVSIKGDRTAKSCQCSQEKICQIIGMHAYAGCRSYATLSTSGQRMIRLWSMDRRDRKNRFSNDVTKRFSDKKRHQQLLYGNSRFCCRTATGRVVAKGNSGKSIISRQSTLRARALRLRSAAATILDPFLVTVLISRWMFL